MYLQAVLIAVFVTFLWSTSWVLIKLGLSTSLPPLTFAGLRYTLAFACLLPLVALTPRHRAVLLRLPRRTWLSLAGLGLVYYTFAQGAQFFGLAYLPAAMLSLILNLTPILVALYSSLTQHEPPTRWQWAGILLAVLGTGAYFLPLALPARLLVGLGAGLISLVTNAAGAVLGRRVNQHSRLHPLLVTTISMGIGGILLLAVGIITQGFGRLAPFQWGAIIWMAVVNTALAFTLWNFTLRVLTAVQSSILNSLMMPQIALLAWLVLAEPLTARQLAGILLVALGTLVVQVFRRG
jgi:drug/metabolite transporter (DMT)-like permease